MPTILIVSIRPVHYLNLLFSQNILELQVLPNSTFRPVAPFRELGTLSNQLSLCILTVCLAYWTPITQLLGIRSTNLVLPQFYYPTDISRVSILTSLRVSISVTLRLYVSFRYLSPLGTSLGYFHCPINCGLHYICRSPLLSWNTKISKQFSSLFSAGLRPFHCVVTELVNQPTRNPEERSHHDYQHDPCSTGRGLERSKPNFAPRKAEIGGYRSTPNRKAEFNSGSRSLS